METTFITIHNTTANANILYASASIIDILGYEASQVQGVSIFDYFHPDDVPFAKEKHSDGILQDKAAVIHYARILNSAREYVRCECVFTVVYDVLVACTSVYKRNERNEQRLRDSESVQQNFKSVPRDPRYFMLEQIRPKFEAPADESRRERRAALILNRFTRTLGIMYATESVAQLLGVTPEQINGKSFYECIHQNCHPEAIRVLESAKANDSIAYLRFWYRDPRRPDEIEDSPSPQSSDSDEEGGVALNQSPTPMPGAYPGSPEDVTMGDDGSSTIKQEFKQEPGIKKEEGEDDKSTLRQMGRPVAYGNERTDSDNSFGNNSDHSMFDSARSQQSRSSTSSAPSVSARRTNGTGIGSGSPGSLPPADAIMVEAVVSCSSDGMVVILRRVHEDEMAAPAPEPAPGGFGHRMQQSQQDMCAMHQQSIFAAPWGAQPIVPGYQPEQAVAIGKEYLPHIQALQAHAAATNGPQAPNFMRAIREVAVFAWAVAGINGNIAQYAQGTPQGPAVPPNGFPVWDQNALRDSIEPPQNQALNKWTELNARALNLPVPLPFIEQENDPAQYYRQERLLRQQYEQPYGSDAPGSSARRHLGKYMGEDGRGPRMLSQGGNWWLHGQQQQEQQAYHNYSQHPSHHQQSYGQSSYGQQQSYGQPQQSYNQQQQYGPPRPPQQDHYSNPYGHSVPAASAQQQAYGQHFHNGYEDAKPAPSQQQFGYGGYNGASHDRPPPQQGAFPPMSTGIGVGSASVFSQATTSYETAGVTAGPLNVNGHSFTNGNNNGYGGPSNRYGNAGASSSGYGSGSNSYGRAGGSGNVSGSGSGSGGSGNNSGREGSAGSHGSGDRFLWY